MKFNGVVITDDITMGAIVNNYDIGDAAVRSVNAGSDIILAAHGYDNALIVLEGLKQAAKSGYISEERINKSVYRILKLKHKYGLSSDTKNFVNINKINEEIKTVLSTYMN